MDLSTQVEAWPSLSFPEFAKKYHDKQEKAFKAAVIAARAVKAARLAGKPVPDFSPACFVRNFAQTSYVVSFEAAFLSGTEVERLTGADPKALGLGKQVSLLLEDSATYLKGWLVSMRGIPEDEARGLRTVRLERRTGVELAEDLMQPKHQLRLGQERECLRVGG